MKKSPNLKLRKVDGTLALEGALDFDNVAQVHEDSEDWFNGEIGAVDLAGIERADSAGLTLLIDWQRRYPELRLLNPPAQLLALAGLSDVEDMLRLRGERRDHASRDQSTSIS